jgi:hypothetical protein
MKRLPPLLLHDGTPEARHAATISHAISPGIEVIDASTAAGRERIRVIELGLRVGTMSMSMPPLFLGDPDPIFGVRH